MIGALDVLVVDDRPETVRFLTEFLLQRCRRVDVAASVKEAMVLITRRKSAGESYHLILSDFVMPEADGLSFLRELRMRKEDIPFVFITGYRSLNPSLETEAKRLGVVAILDKPIELKEIERLLDATTSTFRKQTEKSGDQPFFGTSRVMRRTSTPSTSEPAEPSRALEPRAVPQAATPVPLVANAAPMPAAWSPKNNIALEPRIPDSLKPQPAAPPAPVQPNQPPKTGYQKRPSQIVPTAITTTSRLRRSLDGGLGGGTARLSRTTTPQPPTTFTARTRRGVEGSAAFARQPSGTETGRMVTCTNCAKSFLAAAKAEAYTTVCVHCGQLQKIYPA